MRPPSHHLLPRTVATRAFTLIELLVVISIIAILAGLLLPVGAKVIENSKKVSAKSTMMQIVAAVKNYQTEYGTYPVGTPAGAAAGAATDTTYSDGASGSPSGPHNNPLFTTLRAQNSTSADATIASLNPRRIIYFEYKDAKNPALPRDGFVPAGATTINPTGGVTPASGDLVDPWGNLYDVRIDTGYSDKVVDPTLDSGDDDAAVTDEKKLVHTSVIAWSIGKDSKLYQTGTSTGPYEASGNVCTWK